MPQRMGKRSYSQGRRRLALEVLEKGKGSCPPYLSWKVTLKNVARLWREQGVFLRAEGGAWKKLGKMQD